MNWQKAVGYGVLLWIIMFAAVSIFVGFKIYDNAVMKVVTAIIAGVISWILASYVKPTSASLALSYGLCWVVVGIILDAVVTMRFNDQIFLSKGLWLGYLLVLLAPLLRVKKAIPTV